MTAEPKVFIAIVSWNGKGDTVSCLASVFNIDYANFEVVLVDNSSTDGTAEEVGRSFPRVTVLRQDVNTGFCGGNNSAIEYCAARGAEYIMFLNNDTTVERSILREMIPVMESDPSIGAVNPVIMQEGVTETYFCGARIDWGNGGFFGQYSLKDVESHASVLDIDYATWCAVLVRRAALEKVGNLDESFFTYYEDIDWSVRCKKAGIRTVLFPKVLVRHKISRSTGGEYSPTVYFYLFRNRLIFMRKHAPLARKLQFCAAYISDAAGKSRQLRAKGDAAGAAAVMDGVWSAVGGAMRNGRVTAPAGVKDLRAIEKARLVMAAYRAVFSHPKPAATGSRVAVIVVSCNKKADTLECLKSVFASRYDHYNVILVDNGSEDGTVDAVRSVYPGVVVIENGANLGFGAASNRGIGYAVRHLYDYALFLNNDATVATDTIGLLVERARLDRSTGAVGPVILNSAHEGEIWFRGADLSLLTGLLRYRGPGRDGPFTEVDAISGCAALVKVDALLKCGRFDESYFMYAEDTDLCIRLKRAGYRILVDNTAKAWHKIGRTIGGAGSPNYVYYITRSRLMFMKKNAPAWCWIFFAPYFVYSQWRVYLDFIGKGKRDCAKAIVAAAGDFLTGKSGPLEKGVPV